jgi:peptidoglycan/xylan/chitin deacetylase (PgdA/CDA1 family)
MILTLFELMYPDFIWRIPEKEKTIYLTFDDGPIPEVTPWVLEQLEKYDAKATFFCVGENITKHPEVFSQILKHGHSVGNHTYNHLNGWKTQQEEYFANFEDFEKQQTTVLFRPPYGRIKKKQAKVILKTHKIIMWSVLTKDYSSSISEEKCLKNAIKNTSSGSIVLFHDSLKANRNLYYALPRFLEHFSKQGYTFEKL